MADREDKLPLDSGGFARLDISDFFEERETSPSPPCDWCAEEKRGGGDYLVIADNRHFRLCPLCWGRSSGYLELRQAGASHDTALLKIIAP